LHGGFFEKEIDDYLPAIANVKRVISWLVLIFREFVKICKESGAGECRAED